MSSEQLVFALEANLRVELVAKRAQCAVLAKMEAIALSGDAAGLEAAAEELALELDVAIERARVRERILDKLASELGVAPARVDGVAEALGEEGQRLQEQRAQLREVCAESLTRGRRVATLVRTHGAIVEEALGRFLAADATGAPLGRGSLVDASA
jgi:hypothetical protein